MELLATTNGDLEDVAADELRELVGAEATTHHRGAVTFGGNAEDVYDLHLRSRTLHRVMAVLADTPVDSLDDIYRATRELDLASVLPEVDFGVVGTRHGTHEFTSMDVADRVGQAVIDGYRAATGTRLPVDLDDPTVRLEAYLYDDRFTLAVDLTGASLHERPYRVCEHEAPLRPTLAAALLRIAGYAPGDRLVDPTAGSGTIPIEAALSSLGASPRPDLEPAFFALPGYDAERFRRRREGLGRSGTDVLDLEARDVSERWRECARRNVAAAGLEGTVPVVAADAREAPLEADRVVANLPFGVRTDGDLAALYRGLADRLREGDVGRAVLLTTEPDLVPLEAVERRPLRYGRLETTVLVWEP